MHDLANWLEYAQAGNPDDTNMMICVKWCAILAIDPMLKGRMFT